MTVDNKANKYHKYWNVEEDHKISSDTPEIHIYVSRRRKKTESTANEITITTNTRKESTTQVEE